jgi:hypothetical protein
MSAEAHLNRPSFIKRDQGAETRPLLHRDARASLPTFDEVDAESDPMAQVKLIAPEIPSIIDLIRSATRNV